MTAHFCNKSGVRIVAPGVSKAVDPIHGVDECDPPPVVPKGIAACADCDALIDKLNAVEKRSRDSLTEAASENEKLVAKLAAAEALASDLAKAEGRATANLDEALAENSKVAAKLAAAELALVEANKTIEELTKPAAPPIEQPKAEKADKSAAGGKGK